MPDKKEVVKNYSDDQVIELTTAYKACTTDTERGECMETFKNKFKKSIVSIRTKLVVEKVYIKPKATTKNGSAVKRKSDLIVDIAKIMDVTPETIESFEKGTKLALECFLKYITPKLSDNPELSETK